MTAKRFCLETPLAEDDVNRLAQMRVSIDTQVNLIGGVVPPFNRVVQTDQMKSSIEGDLLPMPGDDAVRRAEFNRFGRTIQRTPQSELITRNPNSLAGIFGIKGRATATMFVSAVLLSPYERSDGKQLRTTKQQ